MAIAHFVGGPLNGSTAEVYGNTYRVVVPPRLVDAFDPGAPMPPDSVIVTYEVASIVFRMPGLGMLEPQRVIMRPQGSFRRDGKPIDPGSN